MEIQYQEFVKILKEVNESKDLSSDNVLKRVQDKLKEKSDENGIDSVYTIVYNIFKSNSFYKNHEFKLQMPDNITASGTLLHFSIRCNHESLVKLLLENKVSVVMKDHNGLSPLHIAASYGYENIVQLLLNDDRVDPVLKDAQGRTPRDMVGDAPNRDTIIEMLKEAEERTKRIAKDLNTKLRDGCTYHLSQDSHGTLAKKDTKKISSVTTAPANVISHYLKQHDATRSGEQTSLNESISDESGLEQDPPVSVKSMIEKFEPSQRRNATCSGEQAPTGESVSSDDSGLELELETASNTSSCSEINHDRANDVEGNVYNQNLENVLQPQEALLEKAQKELAELTNCVAGHKTKLKQSNKENQSLKQEIQNLKSENATLNSKLEENENKHPKTEVLLEKTQEELEKSKSSVVGYETRLKQSNKENESLKQKIQNLENEKATLNSKLEENENKHSKTEVLLKKTQEELEKSKSSVAEYETRLKQSNKENKSLEQENLKATLKGELGKIKTKTNGVLPEKAGKRQFSPRVAYASLATMLTVGALSIASGLSVLLIIATSVTSALIAGGIAYTMSKPTTELKEVDIQGSVQHGVREI